VAEPLVNQYGADVPQAIARRVSAVHPAFDSRKFVADVLQGYDHYREDLALAPTSTGGIWQLAVLLCRKKIRSKYQSLAKAWHCLNDCCSSQCS